MHRLGDQVPGCEIAEEPHDEHRASGAAEMRSIAVRVISETVEPRRCASRRRRASSSAGSSTVVRFIGMLAYPVASVLYADRMNWIISARMR